MDAAVQIELPGLDQIALREDYKFSVLLPLILFLFSFLTPFEPVFLLPLMITSITCSLRSCNLGKRIQLARFVW